MAELTIAKFAELTGTKPSNIHTYVGRGKVIKNENKMIDTNNQINKAFLQLHQAKLLDTTQAEDNSSTKKTTRTKKKDTEPEELTDLAKVTIELKQQEQRKKEIEIQLKENDLKKAKGELVDRKQTIRLISQYSQTSQKAINQGMSILIKDICAHHKIDPGKMGEYVLEVANILNSANKKTVESLLKEFKSL